MALAHIRRLQDWRFHAELGARRGPYIGNGLWLCSHTERQPVDARMGVSDFFGDFRGVLHP